MKPFLSKAASSRGAVGTSSSWKRLFQPTSSRRPNQSSSARGKKRPVAHDENGDEAACGPKKHAKMPTLEPTPQVQTYLDLGQRSFARIIECPECGFAYTHGEEHDEAAHRTHHRAWAKQGVWVRGALAKLHTVAQCDDDAMSCIVLLRLTDGPEAVRKLNEVKQLLDAELGCTPNLPEGAQAYLCIDRTSGRLRGCALAEPLERAYSAVPPSDASTLRDGHRDDDDGVMLHDGIVRDALCGISYIWTEPHFRRHGVARALLDSARQHFAAGIHIPRDMLAFSQPTASGWRLASATDRTPLDTQSRRRRRRTTTASAIAWEH